MQVVIDTWRGYLWEVLRPYACCAGAFLVATLSAHPLRPLPPTLRLPPAGLPAYRRRGELPLASTAKRVWFVAPGWWVVKLVFPRCAPAVTSRLPLGPPGFAPLTCGYDQSVAGGGQRYLARLLDQPSDSRAHFCVRDSTNLAPHPPRGPDQVEPLRRVPAKDARGLHVHLATPLTSYSFTRHVRRLQRMRSAGGEFDPRLNGPAWQPKEPLVNARPPLPPFTRETAIQKVRAAENAWNKQDPEAVSLAYTPDTYWRNRDVFVNGRAEVVEFLTQKWARELDYRLIKELWAFTDDRIAVRFVYESHDADGQWYRSHGNENWEFDDNGLMRVRRASINDQVIAESDRLFHWDAPGPRPDDHPGLTELGL